MRRKRKSPFPKLIITFLSSCRWGFLSGFSGNNLQQLCHTVLRIRGKPDGRRPNYWSQHPEARKDPCRCFAAILASKAFYKKPFQPEPPFTLRAHKPETRVPTPEKGGRGSELESPLLKSTGPRHETKQQISKCKAHPTTVWGNGSGVHELCC